MFGVRNMHTRRHTQTHTRSLSLSTSPSLSSFLLCLFVLAWQVAILKKDENTLCSAKEIGEICVSSPHNVKRYTGISESLKGGGSEG